MSAMLAKLEDSFRSLVNKPADKTIHVPSPLSLKKRSLDTLDNGPAAKRPRLLNDQHSQNSSFGLTKFFKAGKDKISRFSSWLMRRVSGAQSQAAEEPRKPQRQQYYYPPSPVLGNFGTPYQAVPRQTNPGFTDYRRGSASTMNSSHGDSVNMGRGAVPKMTPQMSWNQNANNSHKVQQRQFVKNSTGVPFIQSGYMPTHYQPVHDKVFLPDGAANRSGSRPVKGGNGASGAREVSRLTDKKRYEDLLKAYTSVPLGQSLTCGLSDRSSIFGVSVSRRPEPSQPTPIRESKPIVVDLCDTSSGPITFTAEKSPCVTPMNLNVWERRLSSRNLRSSTPITQQPRKEYKETPKIATTPKVVENGNVSTLKSSHQIGAKSPAVAAFEKTMNESKCMTSWIEDVAESLSSDTLRKERAIREAQLQLKHCEEKKDMWEQEMVLRIKNRLKLSSQEPAVLEDPYEEEKEEEDEFPELGEEAENVISRALRPGPGGEKLSEGFRIQITRSDIATLAGLNWLNDEIINFYIEMIRDRGESENRPKIHAFNTFFYPKIAQSGQQSVRRWTKKVNIFEKDYLLIPVHLGMHWCLCVVSFQEKAIKFYDSMKGAGEKILHAVKQYLIDEMKDKQGKAFDMSGWNFVTVKDIPPQLNGSDCGVFTCKYADYISLNKKITFDQSNMPYFRRRMVYEILTKKLILS